MIWTNVVVLQKQMFDSTRLCVQSTRGKKNRSLLIFIVTNIILSLLSFAYFLGILQLTLFHDCKCHLRNISYLKNNKEDDDDHDDDDDDHVDDDNDDGVDDDYF